jgi:hypothetical protein
LVSDPLVGETRHERLEHVALPRGDRDHWPKAMVMRPVMSYTLAPRCGAGTFVVGVVEFGEIANMDKRALWAGR